MAIDPHRSWIRGRGAKNLDGHRPTSTDVEIGLVLTNNNRYRI